MSCCRPIGLYGIERPQFCDDAINPVVVVFGGDRIDDLGVIAHPDEGGSVPGGVQGIDEAIIEPCAASEPVSGVIEREPGEQDHIELLWADRGAPVCGHTDVVSAKLKVGVQICDPHGGHGLTGPVDARDGDGLALFEGGGDEGVEGELGSEGGVGEDRGGPGDGGVGEEVRGDGLGGVIAFGRVEGVQSLLELLTKTGFVILHGLMLGSGWECVLNLVR